jgi:23S rRNA pseudouridine2605 synthase
MTRKSRNDGDGRGGRGHEPDRPRRLPSKPKPKPLARPTAPAAAPVAKTGERVAKVIARAGLGSRREAEEWIAAGRVALNGTVITSPAVNVGAADTISVDGAPLPARERTRLFLYHKPVGLVTTTADPENRPTIFGALPPGLPRLVSVGRLDLNTEGLLLLTNDGGLARVLELPETGWLRRYRVRAHGSVTQPALDALRDGIEVDGIHYGPIEAVLDREQGSNVWITFAMREGKNREIRNVLGALGLKVNRLIRLSFGPFQLGDLGDGAIEEVKTRTLRDQVGERIAAQAGADFTAPLIEHDAAPAQRPKAVTRETPARETRERDTRERREARPAARPPRREARERAMPERREPRGPQGARRSRDRAEAPPAEGRSEGRPRRPKAGARTGRTGHVWRDQDLTRSSPSGNAVLRRRQRTETPAATAAADVPGPRRKGLVTDRKGRQVMVERVGAEPPEASREGGRPAGPPKDRAARHGDPRRGNDRPRGEDGAARPPREGQRPWKGRRDERPARERAKEGAPWKGRGERPSGDGRKDRPWKARAGDARPPGARSKDRPWKARDRDESPRRERPGGGRPPRPRNDRPGGDRPRGDRPRGDRPRGDRPGGDRPRGPRPARDR